MENIKKDNGYPIDIDFDKIVISSSRKKSDLIKDLTFPEIKAIRLIQSNYSPYSSQIILVAPSKKVLGLLLLHEWSLGLYKISYLELTKETYFATADDAKIAAFKIGTTTRKKWSGMLVYDTRWEFPLLEEGFDTITFYAGTPYCKNGNYNNVITDEFGNCHKLEKKEMIFIKGKFKLSIYSRPSKRNGSHCAHEEFRISSAGEILKKTGIKSLSDLVNADLKTIFETLSQKHLTKVNGINYLKFGLWLLNKNNRKKLTEEEIKKAVSRGRWFCRFHDIKIFTELVTFLRIEKQRVKSKGSGRLSFWDKKILKVGNVSRFIQ